MAHDWERGSRIVGCWLIVSVLALGMVRHAWGEDGKPDLYLSDMSKCSPASALSDRMDQGKWRLIEYASDTVTGTMLTAPSFIEAPDVTLRLDAQGWHAIYIGYWNPHFAYDGQPVLKIKLSEDAAFRRIHDTRSPDTQHATHLREVYVRTDDLAGQDLVIGKLNGPLGKGAYLAYVKPVPLTPEQADKVQADRKRRNTRNLVAAIDGASYFHFGECRRREHILEQIELYRHSDVAKVLWAVCYGETTNYPTEVEDAIFLGSDKLRAHLVSDDGANEYVRGEKQAHETLKSLASRGLIPQQIAADHTHAMGLKFDIMFRLGILGGIGPLRVNEGNFVRRHPEFRQVRRDGTVLEKASYAFDEVQQFMLSLIREATQRIDADGINLCFVRGPHFLLYENPVLDAFRKEYGADAREVDPADPRLLEVRASLMTDFLRKVRKLLDRVGQTKGKRLELSVWVWPSNQNVWLGETPIKEGLDVKQWIREGLLDSVICQQGVDADYMSLGKESGCQFILFTGYRGDRTMSPQTVTEAYKAGVSAFAYWDMDAVQIYPGTWNWLRRIGHRDEMASWDRFDPGSRLIRLKKVAGVDVEKGLIDAVYSGG